VRGEDVLCFHGAIPRHLSVPGCVIDHTARSSSQTLLVIAGYVVAFVVASVVVSIYVAATNGAPAL
jgi:hypothetical protein